MNAANKLINGAGQALDESDAGLARRLGVNRSQLSDYRANRKPMPDWIAVQLAQWAGYDPGAALATLHAEHAPADTRPVWQSILARIGPLALAGIVATAAIPPKAPKIQELTDSVYYVK